MDLQELQEKLAIVNDIERLMEVIGWREFEDVCAEFWENMTFQPKGIFASKQIIDLRLTFSQKGRIILLIDCKHWTTRKGKSSALKFAARKQKERERAFNEIKFLGSKNEKTYSLIITFLQEDLIRDGGVWIVPVFMLNFFLLEIEKYLEQY